MAVRNAVCDPDWHKPTGLWVSIGEAWPAWCLENEYGVGRLCYATPVTINAAANILTLGHPWDLDEFTHKYSKQRGDYWLLDRRCIDWQRVQDEYDGIIIAPYQWERRLELSWYYSWDVASGCIWNANAITVGPSLYIGGDTRQQVA